MYFFFFNRFAGIDRVFLCKENHHIQPGDLIETEGTYALCLGYVLPVPERYTLYRPGTDTFKIVFPHFFSENVLELLHWMVNEWYTTYKKVIPLFCSESIEKNLCLYKKPNKKKQTWQYLLVFPDIWTLTNSVSRSFFIEKTYCIMTPSVSEKQQIMLRTKIRQGEISHCACTWGEIFQDWNNLVSITLHDPHKWYYAAQQDPRYKVASVLKKLAEIYKAHIILEEI